MRDCWIWGAVFVIVDKLIGFTLVKWILELKAVSYFAWWLTALLILLLHPYLIF